MSPWSGPPGGPERDDARWLATTGLAPQSVFDRGPDFIHAIRLLEQYGLLDLAVEPGGIHIAGDKDDRQIGTRGAQLSRQLASRHPRHRVVRHQHIDPGAV